LFGIDLRRDGNLQICSGSFSSWPWLFSRFVDAKLNLSAYQFRSRYWT